jgi:hypothetical protein
MIYSGYTFQGCYSAISALQAYFLPTHGNREASVLGKLPYVQDHRPKLDILALQEHKLRRESLHQLGTRIWRPAIFGGFKASMGYGYS